MRHNYFYSQFTARKLRLRKVLQLAQDQTGSEGGARSQTRRVWLHGPQCFPPKGAEAEGCGKPAGGRHSRVTRDSPAGKLTWLVEIRLHTVESQKPESLSSYLLSKTRCLSISSSLTSNGDLA